MVAPSKHGRYVSYWRLSTPDGTRFGQRVWVDVIVASENEEKKVEKSAAMEVETVPTAVATPNVVQQEIPAISTPIPIPAVATPNVVQFAVPTETPISAEHQQLIDMGFHDKEMNFKLLAKNNNDVLKTVQDLLNY